MAIGDETPASEKVKSVFNYVTRADLSNEEVGQLIGLLIVHRLQTALAAGLGDLGAD